MNNDMRANMAVEDSENNNVDENSNDHQYNEYANYHNQYTNHQFRRHVNDDDIPVLPNRRVEANQNEDTHRVRRNSVLPSDQDTIDSLINSRSFSSHRRNMSEDLSINSHDLPPLPRNFQNDARHQHFNNSQMNSRRPSMTDELIRGQGRNLLYNFAAEQFRKEHLNLDDYLHLPVSPQLAWKREGRNLRLLADEFARSQEREELRYRAQRVHMTSLTCENFFQLCNELFHKDGGGITQERIVVLFTFISDIAIQQVRQRAERFLSQLMEWSVRFIFDHICAWVREAGGWGVVLSRGANLCYKITIFVFAAVSIVALGIFIKKSWKDL